MRRRGHGEGSLYKRPNGEWVGMVNLGIVDGKRKRQSFSGATQAEVIAKVKAALHARSRGIPVPPERQTFAAFADKWLTAVRPTLRDTSFRRYASLMAPAVRAFGNTPLVRLTAADLQRLYEERRKAGSAPKTILNIHRAIHRALVLGEKWGDVAHNVARLATPPKVERSRMQALSADEARLLMDAAKGDRLEGLVVLDLATGLRLGELLGLTWRSIDLDTGSLRVEASLQRTSNGLELVEPKTSRSRRQILVEPRIVAALRRHKAAQVMERRVAGNAWIEGDYVFTTTTGLPLDGSKISRTWLSNLLKRAGLPRIRFHDLRHSYASIALARGIHPKVVQEAMGHSTIAVTMDTYSHVLPSLQREAAREMGAALFGA